MTRVRTWTIRIIFIIMAVLLPGCGSGDSKPRLLKEWTAETTQEATGVQTTGKIYRVGMITDIGGVKDQGFNQSAWEGLLAFRELTGSVTTFLESSTAEDLHRIFPLLWKMVIRFAGELDTNVRMRS